jgi:hypothetical protein
MSSAIPFVSGTLLSMNVSGTLFSMDMVGTFIAVTTLLSEGELHFKLHSWTLFETFD